MYTDGTDAALMGLKSGYLAGLSIKNSFISYLLLFMHLNSTISENDL